MRRTPQLGRCPLCDFNLESGARDSWLRALASRRQYYRCPKCEGYIKLDVYREKYIQILS